jgi:hypothetical protein
MCPMPGICLTLTHEVVTRVVQGPTTSGSQRGLDLPQTLPRLALDGTPTSRFPRRRGGARDRVLHAGRIEGGLPAPPVVARELEVVALVRHAAFDVADTGRSASMRARFQRDEEQAPEAVSHDCPRLRRH